MMTWRQWMIETALSINSSVKRERNRLVSGGSCEDEEIFSKAWVRSMLRGRNWVGEKKEGQGKDRDLKP